MKTHVSSTDPPVSPRCAEIRPRLADFAARKLGPLARGEVQGHLLTCDACSDALAELLMEQVDSGVLPLLPPVSVPEPTAYEHYLRAHNSPRSWRAVRHAQGRMESWAKQRLDEIRVGFAQLAASHPGAEPLSTAVRWTRGAAAMPRLTAAVLNAEGEPSGIALTFEVRRPPRVEADHQFRFIASTDADEYRGRWVICTITLPGTEPLSFEGTLESIDRRGGPVVSFDEAGIPAPAIVIPLDIVTLTIP